MHKTRFIFECVVASVRYAAIDGQIYLDLPSQNHEGIMIMNDMSEMIYRAIRLTSRRNDREEGNIFFSLSLSHRFDFGWTDRYNSSFSTRKKKKEDPKDGRQSSSK